MTEPRRRIAFRLRVPGRRSERPPSAKWITILFILLIGIILWIGVLSDSTGQLTMPDAGSIIYVAVVIGGVGLLAFADRKRNARAKTRGDRDDTFLK